MSGRGQNRSGGGVNRAVSQGVWPPCHRGDGNTVDLATSKDGTTRAVKDGPVWFDCSAPAVRYGGEYGADSAHANHDKNEPSMKGLNKECTFPVSLQCSSKCTSTGHIQLQGAVGGDRGGFRQDRANFNFSHLPVLNKECTFPVSLQCSSKCTSTGHIQLQGAVGGDRGGFRQDRANFNFSHLPVLTL